MVAQRDLKFATPYYCGLKTIHEKRNDNVLRLTAI